MAASRYGNAIELGLGTLAWLAIVLPVVARGNEDARDQAADDGRAASLVRVQLPITGNADQVIRNTLTRARDRLTAKPQAGRPVLVIEITPAPGAAQEGAGSQFERALALAEFLTSREMTEVKTIAYVPRSIRGHGILLAIACEELFMAPDAEVGDASGDGEAGRTVVTAYREIADRRRTFPEALAVGLVDPNVEVVQVESEQGVDFLLGDQLEEFRLNHEVISEVILAERGATARFSGGDGREFGFVQFLPRKIDDVARELNVAPESLVEDQSLSDAWDPIVLEIRGEITPRVASELETSLGTELKRGANWICLRIDSSGGDLPASLQIASMFAALDPNSVRTVAYVPVEARGSAALPALACDQLVMHPDAQIGVSPPFENDPPQAPAQQPRKEGPNGGINQLPQWPLPAGQDDGVDDQLVAANRSIRASLADKTDHSWSLLSAMIDPSVEVFFYRNRATGQEILMSAAEADALVDSDDWIQGPPVADGGGPLVLRGEEARELQIAWQTVSSFDEVMQLFGIEVDPPLIQLNWAQQLVQAMAAPGFAALLVMIGLAGLYIEIKTPGMGIGGFVATVAFALFFWSKALDQTAGWLEVVLVLTGLIFLLLEAFVFPGFGIFGLGGGILIIFALVLASQTFVIPRTESDMIELRRSITVVAGGAVGMLGFVLAVRRYLPRAPLFNRIVLEPPRPEDRIDLEHRETVVDYSHLVGQGGTATTDLRPSGKARIGDELIDVIAESEPLDRGTAVVVVDAHASRVVVRRVG